MKVKTFGRLLRVGGQVAVLMGHGFLFAVIKIVWEDQSIEKVTALLALSLYTVLALGLVLGLGFNKSDDVDGRPDPLFVLFFCIPIVGTALWIIIHN